MICSQSRKYSLSRRLFSFFEYIIHPLDKYCQRFPLPIPLFSVGLCLLLSFHSLRRSTERLFYVKTEADGKSPPAPPLIATRPRTSPAFLDTESYLTLILRRESRQNKHFTGMAVAGITATFGTNATRWFANLIFAILCENQVRPDAPPQQKATPLTGVAFCCGGG